MTRFIAFWTSGCIAMFLASSVAAQTYPVTAGEHPNFTRIVIHTPPGTDWALDSETPQHRLTISPPTAQFDLSRLFDRIPRTRLGSASANAGHLDLSVNCDCETRAWEERPGLIVIDLRDAPAEAPLTQLVPTEQSPPAAEHATSTQTARVAGLALAEAHTREHLRGIEESVVDTPAPSQALTRSLGLPIAQALSQGLLEPAPSAQDSTRSLLMNDTGLALDLPENMRVATVIDRPNPEASPPEVNEETCQGVQALGFLVPPATEPFDVAFGRITRTLYGEFDQPNPEARRELVELYLAAGFGAEARALIANDATSVVGRDLLLGMSDVLEDRSSNSRMRLGQFIGCGGPAALMAAMAGASPSEIREYAPQIALTFTEIDASLRTILGADLARILIDAQAIDAARIVIDSTHRSPWTASDSLDLIDALLERARGRSPDAAARLEYAQGTDPASVQARLALALENNLLVALDALADAESLASTERRSAQGSDIMSSVVRLYARAAAYPNAFNALDRLQTWNPQLSEAAQNLHVLRDELWKSVADNSDDLTMMRTILGREDWRDPALDLSTRQALAQRLLGLGLGGQVIDVLHESRDEISAVLLARAHIAQNQPQRAIDTLENLETIDAQRIRAAALAALGQNASASQQFEAIQDNQDAQRTAILARDWDRVQRLADPESRGQAYDIDQVGQVMGHAPGHLELALQTPEPTPPQPALAAPEPIASQEGIATEQGAPETPLAETPAPVIPDFDRLGLITRSATLLDESARLREILTPLAAGEPTLGR